MTEPADLLERGRNAHRSGRLDEAASLYRAALAADPADADALHLLGVIADANGEPARAVDLIGQALAIRDSASCHSNLGMALGHLGRHEDALRSYERALALRPDYPEALMNQGVSLQALRRPAEAEQAYRRALALRPHMVEAATNLGHVLSDMGRSDEAVAAYAAALEHDPAAPRTLLAHALRDAGRPREAQAVYREEASRRPDDPEALTNLAAALSGTDAELPERPELHASRGQALQELGRLEEAVAACERALALRPDYPEALNNLGNALRGLGRLDASERALRRAVALRPRDPGGYNNLAVTLGEQDRPHEALAVLDLAHALDPDDAETHHHRAMLLLRLGRLAEGWDSYDWRFRTRQAGRAGVAPVVPWQGEPIDGKTILLMAEQGFGDMIQFARYVPLLAARGARVVWSAQPALLRLMRSLPAPVDLVEAGSPVPPHDVRCPLLSLPRAFGTTLQTIPATIPYLHPEPEAARRWADRLGAATPGRRVGLVWAGNPRHLNDARRSLPFTALAPLWAVSGVRWFSLQVGVRAADVAADDRPGPPGGIEILAPELPDFAETAAAVASLDLVITVDTAVAHLAGALGRPVWLLLPRVPDWRWMRGNGSSPWYPTMWLFRQDDRCSWHSVVEQVATRLAETA